MPGPRPAYRPDFPADFVAQCQQLVIQRTVAYQLRQRARLVLLFYEHPLCSHGEAAARVGLHPDSVRHWRQRWAQGDFSLEDAPGRGRNPHFSPAGSCAGQGRGLRELARTQKFSEKGKAPPTLTEEESFG